MSEMLEWRERLEGAHKQMQDAMTELITNKTIRKRSSYCTLSISLCWN
jgi:hypothetical protein